MLDRRWRKVLGDLYQHRGRMLLAALAIAVGLAGSGAVLNTWALLRVATEAGFRASNPASATLWTDSIDSALLARVRAVPGVRDAQARQTAVVTMRAQGQVHSALLFAAPDLRDVRIGRLAPEVGSWPPADGEIAIERSAFTFSGASVGEAVFIGPEGRDGRPVAVTGIVRDVGLAPGWMERTVYGFVTPATLTSLGLRADFSELLIVVDRDLEREQVRSIALAVRDSIARTGRTVHEMAVPEPNRHVHAAQMGSLGQTQIAFGILALLCAAFLVMNLMAAILAGQVREIGVMKAMGARPGQVATIYLGIAAMIGLAASGLALPAALRFGRTYAEFRGQLLNFPIDAYGVPWWIIALEMAVGMLVPVAAAWIPVRRATRMSVGDALRDVGVEQTASSSPMIRVRGPARPLMLSVRNAFRRRTRMALTLTTLTLAGATFIAALNLRHAVRDAVGILYAPFQFDFSLRVAGDRPLEALEARVRAEPGVRVAEAWTTVRVTPVAGQGMESDPITILGVPARSAVLRFIPTAGRWLREDDGATLIVPDGRMDSDPFFHLGGAVRLRGAEQASTWNVVGAVEGGGPVRNAFAPRAAVTAAGNAATLVVVAADVPGQGAELELIARLRRELARGGWEVVASQRLAEARLGTEEHLVMVVDFLTVMAWVMVAVGGLGLASTMSLAVLERTREIGVLRVIGAGHGTIHMMVQVEGLVIGLLSWGVAVPLSVPMSAVMASVFGRIFLRLPVAFLPSAPGVGAWFGVVIVTCLLASGWPAVRATRVTPASALAYE